MLTSSFTFIVYIFKLHAIPSKLHSTICLFSRFCEHIVRVLGFDWLLAFFLPGVHYGTIILALRILLYLLQHEHLLCKFREGAANGGWLADGDSVVRNRSAVSLNTLGSIEIDAWFYSLPFFFYYKFLG